MIYLALLIIIILAVSLYKSDVKIKEWKTKYYKLKKDYDHFVNIIVLRDRRNKIKERNEYKNRT